MKITRKPHPKSLKDHPKYRNTIRYFESEDYQIFVSEFTELAMDPLTHLRIARIDREPIRNYMDIYEIKNFVLGEDVEAIEVYPKKENFVNGSNTYHLWSWDGMYCPNYRDYY